MKQRAEIVILQTNASGSLAYWQERDNQSVADRNGISMAEYIHAIYGLLHQAKARSVLVIGCAGGTLATMLRRSGVAVTIVDIDPLSFVLARSYFHMPDDVTCIASDGATYLRRETARYDAIVLDAYADEAIPRHLVKTRFFESVKARLKRGGIFLINVIIDDDEDLVADRICWRLKKTFRQVKLLDTDGWIDRNAVIAAGAVGKLTPPRLLMRPATGARAIAAALKPLGFRPLKPV